MEYLYKIMKYEYFTQMVESKQLYFVHPSKWWEGKDSNELLGYLELINRTCDVDLKTCLYVAYSHHYAQSWTSVVGINLWKKLEYFDSDVAIAVKYQNILMLRDVVVKNVVYKDNIIEFISRLEQKNDDIIKVLCTKSSKFKDEREVRLISQEKKTFQEYKWEALCGAISSKFKNNDVIKNNLDRKKNHPMHRGYYISESIRHGNNTQDYCSISYADINNFISCVYYHPKISRRDLKELKDFCDQNCLIVKELGC